MGWVGGQIGYSPLPWGREFEMKLMRAAEHTYEHQGEDLAHEMHKTIIETNMVMVQLYQSLARRLTVLLIANVAVLAFLLWKFGL